MLNIEDGPYTNVIYFKRRSSRFICVLKNNIIPEQNVYIQKPNRIIYNKQENSTQTAINFPTISMYRIIFVNYTVSNKKTDRIV